jgi:hypothetical protein
LKGIAAVLGAAGPNKFYLGSNFEMMASLLEVSSDGSNNFRYNLNFGGIFTSVPAVVLSMARRVINHTLTSSDGDHTAAKRPGIVIPDPLLEQRIDVFGLGLDYSMYTKVIWGKPTQSD